MFQSLTEKLGRAFDNLRGKSSLQEEDVDLAMREIRTALLEADVALPVVRDFITAVKAKAVGQQIIKSVSPVQQVVKIVNDEIESLLGGDGSANALKLDVTPPAVVLMVGLQGSGKTTTTGKLGKFLTEKQRRKVLLASLDVHRPAAQEQLRVLGEQVAVATLPIVAGQSPLEITARALDEARLGGYDVLLLDTAGRLSIDDALMDEVKAIKTAANPVETLLVVDAMTGQDALNTATNFHERIGVTGIVMTRMDGDARGGAAMSMRSVTGQAIKFVGTGEKLDGLEAFFPDRVAGRILGMGDVVGLVEKALETIDQDDAARMAQKFQDGHFDLEDFSAQLRQMKTMGGVNSLMKMLPGVARFAPQLEAANIGDDMFRRQEAILSSMTKAERKKPALISASASRRRRIAEGAGATVPEVNKLLKQFEQMQGMMKLMRRGGMGGMMQAAKSLMGEKTLSSLLRGGGTPDAAQLQELMQNPSPDMASRFGVPGLGRPSKSHFTKSPKSKRKK